MRSIFELKQIHILRKKYIFVNSMRICEFDENSQEFKKIETTKLIKSLTQQEPKPSLH